MLDEPLWESVPFYDNLTVIEPDTLEDPPLETRIRYFYTAEGLYVGVFTFLRKLAGAGGVAIAFLALDLVGFQSDAENSDQALWVLRGVTAFIPACFVVASAWVARKYPLSHGRHQEIILELERRRGAIEVGAPGG